jgi:hypothetical protein
VPRKQNRIVVGVDGSGSAQGGLAADSWRAGLRDLVETTWCARLAGAGCSHRVELRDGHPVDVLLGTAEDKHAKLSHARFERVCFEVDELDTAHRTGWSVLLKGVLHELREDDRHVEELDHVAARIGPWAAGAKAHVLVVTPVGVTGRRIVGE